MEFQIINENDISVTISSRMIDCQDYEVNGEKSKTQPGEQFFVRLFFDGLLNKATSFFISHENIRNTKKSHDLIFGAFEERVDFILTFVSPSLGLKQLDSHKKNINDFITQLINRFPE